MTIVMLFTIGFKPADNDWIQENLSNIFTPMTRFFIASMIAYLISQYFDVWIYGLIKKISANKNLWLRNNISTFLSSLIDNTVFSFLAWIILNPNPEKLYNVIMIYIFGTYLMRVFIAILDTPFLYFSLYQIKKMAKSWQISFLSKKSMQTGYITTPNGVIKTPAFIFCATKAALKSITTTDAKKIGTQIILSNTYHLMLQPGSKLVADHGGLHKFMNWKGPLLTDSGGFQIFSLGHGSVSDEIKGRRSKSKRNKSLLKIDEEGALFKSYLDGKNHLLSPEKSIQIQRNLGADLILVFDECTPFNVDKTYTEKSMQRSHRWARRSLNSFNSKLNYNPRYGSSGEQRLYGIVQGGVYEDFVKKVLNLT